MDLEPQEPGAASSQQDLHETGNEQIGWANIFYGMIIAPATPLNVLAKPRLYKTDTRGVLGALITIFLCGLVGSTQCELDRGLPLFLAVLISLLGDLSNWLILAVMLLVIAR